MEIRFPSRFIFGLDYSTAVYPTIRTQRQSFIFIIQQTFYRADGLTLNEVQRISGRRTTKGSSRQPPRGSVRSFFNGRTLLLDEPLYASVTFSEQCHIKCDLRLIGREIGQLSFCSPVLNLPVRPLCAMSSQRTRDGLTWWFLRRRRRYRWSRFWERLLRAERCLSFLR